MIKRSILGTKGQFVQRTLLDLEGGQDAFLSIRAHSDLTPKIHGTLLCIIHRTFIRNFFEMLRERQVFLTFQAPCKIFEGRAHLYTPFCLSNYKKSWALIDLFVLSLDFFLSSWGLGKAQMHLRQEMEKKESNEN